MQINILLCAVKLIPLYESSGDDERKVSLGKEEHSRIYGAQYRPSMALTADYFADPQLYDVIK